VSHDILRMTLGLGALALGLPLTACGGFAADPTGQGGSGGTSPMAGSPASSGAGGSNVAGGGAAAGGAAGSMAGGSGGSGGVRPEPPEPACTDVAACGGEVAGVWFASGSCLPLSGMADISEFGLGCKEVAAEGKLEVTGNWTLNADKTMSDNTTTTGQVKMELAKACLNISGTVTQCDRVPAQLGALGLKETVCVNSTVTEGGCTCDSTISQMGSMGHVVFDTFKMGTYATASNKLTTTGIDSVEYDYCVQGPIMLVTPKVNKAIGQLNGTVVFVKQD
jgi:hypothetical protein